MYKISYEKCVYFIFLVIFLAVLSCSGFRIDNLAMTDISSTNHNDNNSKRNYFHTSTNLNVAAALHPANFSNNFNNNNNNNDKNFSKFDKASPFSSLLSSYNRQRKHRIRHHRLLKVQQRLESLRNSNLNLREKNHGSIEAFVLPPQPPLIDPHPLLRSRAETNPNHWPVTRTQRSFPYPPKHSDSTRKNNRKSKIYCQENDITRKAYLAKIVVKVSAQSVERDSSKITYSVVFQKIEVLKNETNWPVDERITLTFMKNGSTQCDQQQHDQHHPHIYDNNNNNKNNNHYSRYRSDSHNNVRNQDYRNKLVKANIKPNKEYILFLNAYGLHNYTAFDTPELFKSKKLLKNVLRVTNKNFKPKDPQIISLELVKVNRTESKNVPKLKLVCKTRRGLPVPYTVWKRNDTVLQPNSRIHIKYKKRKSTLVIKNVTEEDRGLYECIAHGVNDKVAKKSIDISSNQILKLRPSISWTSTRKPSTTISENYGEEPCELKLKEVYCQNGGTCYNQTAHNEIYCVCPTGYKGHKCEEKEPKETSMYIQPARSSCKSGLSTKYHCNNTEIDTMDYST